MSDDLPVRMSVRELYDPHNPDKNKEKRYALLKAWRRLNDLPPENPNSFYAIAGYHGAPFVPSQKDWEGYVGGTYWGGYCQHQNVLFPFWHRLYLVRLEQALQTVEPEAMIPYWDQTSKESLKNGIPALLTEERVKISDDGEEVENPLKSFILEREINHEDQKPSLDGTDTDVDMEKYIKPVAYETKRYPFAGLLGPRDKEQTEKHNRDLEKKNKGEITKMLNAQIKKWLTPPPLKTQEPDEKYRRGIYHVYKQCLDAPTYNIFSNTSTAGTKKRYGLNSLENPHNWMHLAIGGFPYRKHQADEDKDFIDKASGDMAFNEIAAFDPIFFMHHCNVDRMFWIWQKLHTGMTDKLEIDERDPKDYGVVAADGQGASPYQTPKQKLTLDTPLHPFTIRNMLPNTSRNAINIETQLNYTYSEGSFFEKEKPEPVDSDGVTYLELDGTKEKDAEENFKNDVREYYQKNKDFGPYKKMITSVKVLEYKRPTQQAGPGDPVDPIIGECFNTENIVTVENIKLEAFGGSFAVYLSLEEEEIGVDAFFSRMNRTSCANCQDRPGFVIASFDITDFIASRMTQKKIESKNFRAYTRDNTGLTSRAEEQELITLYHVYKPWSIIYDSKHRK